MIDRLLILLKAQRSEFVPLVWSFIYFYCLLCSYYILRPIRDEMGIQSGVENLQWVFTGTFVAMLLAVPLFGWVVSRFSRDHILPVVYSFFIVNLLLFYLLFSYGLLSHEAIQTWVARAFFIWVSVFNLFVVSVFWSFMADIFSSHQAKRLFGVIAAGGSAGAITGPALTAGFGQALGPANLIPVSIGFLVFALICIYKLTRWNRAHTKVENTDNDNQGPSAIAGSIFAGATRMIRSPYLMGIGLFILLYTCLATFLYFQQAYIVEKAFTDSGERTAFFATIDLLVNSLTVIIQLFVTSRLVERLGLSVAICLIPILMMTGFFLLGQYPLLMVLVVFQVIRRAGNYAITRPLRETLFTVVSREDKYKSKSFIDTVVYRGGDALSGWIYAGLSNVGLGLSAIAYIAVPAAAGWALTGYLLGRWHTQLTAEHGEPGTVTNARVDRNLPDNIP